jgi:hypothetical protein
MLLSYTGPFCAMLHPTELLCTVERLCCKRPILNPMPGVFQNIEPPPPGECVPPAFGGHELLKIGATCAGTKCALGLLVTGSLRTLGQLVRGQHVHWDYLSEGGHEHWGELSKGGVVQGRIKVVSPR